MNKQQRLKQLIAALALAGFFAPVCASAQDGEAGNQAATLAAEAITAKESGDLVAAKAKLEELVKLTPADDSAKALLTDVNKEILSKAAPAAPAKPLTALDRAAEENLNLFHEVDSAKIEANGLASRGEFDAAVSLLDQAASALPVNTAGQGKKDELTLLRQQIIAARDSGKDGVKRIAAEAISNQVKLSRDRITDARKLISEANSAISDHHFDDASANLDKAASLLPNNSTADTARIEIKKARSRLHEARYAAAVDVRDMKTAEKAVADYEELNGKTDRRAQSLRSDLTEKQADPHFKGIADVSPEFYAREKKANELLAKGRAQYLYGDYLGALATYAEVNQYQPYNTEAKSFSIKIREILHEKSGRYNLDVTKANLLEDVDAKWILAQSFNKDLGPKIIEAAADPVITRMKGISLPQVTLKDMKLDRVIETLGELSQSYDKEQKGVNFVIIDPEHKNPDVNSLTLRDMPLDVVLEKVLRSVSYSYSVNNGVVEIRPDTGNSEAETEFFPLSKQSLARMTGIGAGVSTGTSTDPFGGGGAAAGAGGSPEVDGLKRYFRSAGIEFEGDGAKGTGIGYDGAQIIVTHNRRSLERIRNIVRRYSDSKQVAIETKFIEVTQGTLNQIAANWTVVNRGLDGDRVTAATGNRTLDSAFRTTSGGSPGSVVQVGQPAGTLTDGNGTTVNVDAVPPQTIATIPNSAPTIPGASNFGNSNTIGAFTGADGLPANGFTGTFTSGFSAGGYDVNLFIQALEQTTGSDLMAAPSLTVASGTTATIKIAQLLRYPESYSPIQSQVGGGGNNNNNNNNNGGGSGSVSITAGTPQDFVEKEVGVVMEVVPTVSESGDSIDLDLKPKITEFEGFVEYGGTSVAVSGTTVVTVPSGFYQPIFSIREVVTKVTVYDGSTVVIGGLTREEVKTVHDKVPVLGDMPLIGKLFQSNGKTQTKKNLMIFVTANMISPNGSPLRTNIGGVRAGAAFQNPTAASPSGPIYRSPVEKGDK